MVDDAKFSSAIIGRALEPGRLPDVRFANSAAEPCACWKSARQRVLLADWLMPEMDGLELTGRVRQLDETAEHYTYVILLTGKEAENVLVEAFDRGVDDFISKAAMNEQLIAARICRRPHLYNTLQRLLNENRMLTMNVAKPGATQPGRLC